MRKTQVIILAGGSGERFGGDLPKQFVKIAGRTIIEHTIDRMEHCKVIDSVIIVVNDKYYEYMNSLVLKNHFTKVKKVILGGNTRQESSYAGMNACDEDTQNVLFHDAIRPFVSEKIMTDVVTALETYEAVDVAIPCADTIIKVTEDKRIDTIPKRKYLMRGQTPQGFRLSLIKAAYERYMRDQDILVTDDCGIINQYRMADIYVVEGEEQNIKITYREDAYLADKLFQTHSMRTAQEGTGQEVLQELSNKVGIVIGHTSGIGKEIVGMVRDNGGIIHGFSRQNGVDVQDYGSVEQALRQVYGQEGRVDYVINTSGELCISKLEAMDAAHIGRMTMTNYLGSVQVTKAAIPYLKESGGCIILFTSSSYTRGRAMYSIYSSTKAAIVNFAQAMSEELFEDRIRINVMNPERTDTPMRRKNFGVEPKDSLLDAKKVALETLKVIGTDITGQVVDVRR